jgi:hypothetical protein
MKNQLTLLSVAVVGATLVSPCPQAQGRGAGIPVPASRGGGAVVVGHAAPAHESRMGMGRPMRRARGYYAGAGYGGYGYAPYADSDVLYASDFDPTYEPMSEEMGPQVVSREPSPAAVLAPPAKSSGGMVLQLEGDHWVRMTSSGPPQIVSQTVQTSSPASAGSSAKTRVSAVAKPPVETPRAVLVFRDGHQEEIGQYRIMGGMISVAADYWSTGSWTRKVPVSDLDVPATLKVNGERGTHFRLPSGPNEMMIGG